MVVLGTVMGFAACQQAPASDAGERTGLVEEARAQPPAEPVTADSASAEQPPLPAAERPPVAERPTRASSGVDSGGVAERTDQASPADESEAPADETPPSPDRAPPPPPPPVTESDMPAASPGATPPRPRPRVERRVAEPEGPEDSEARVPEAPEPDLVVPAGSRIVLEVQTRLTSQHAWPGDRFRARVVDDVLDDQGMVLVPMGAVVEGVVSRAVRGDGDDRRPALEIEPKALLAGGRVYDLEADVADVELRTEGVRDGKDMAKKAATGAAAGAILGKILGKNAKSTIAGAVAGAAAGAAVGAASGDPQVILDEGARLEIVLKADLRLQDDVWRPRGDAQ